MFAIEKNPRLARFPVAVQQSKEVASESLKNPLRICSIRSFSSGRAAAHKESLKNRP